MKGFIRLAGPALLASCATTISAAIFTVTTTNDSGPGSLRQAISDANVAADVDTIRFNIGSGPRSIGLISALPVLTQPVIIDGSTEPGFAGSPIIELNGTGAGSTTSGLKISSSNCVVRSIAINRFGGHGIEVLTNGNNIVQGCII